MADLSDLRDQVPMMLPLLDRPCCLPQHILPLQILAPINMNKGIVSFEMNATND